MTPAGLLVQALVVLSALVVLLAAAIAGRRAVWQRQEQRHRRLSAPVRPLLLELAAGDPDEQRDAVAALAGLPTPTWRAVEPSVVAMLGKVRGEARAAVVSLLSARGALVQAERDLGRRGAVRRARAAELLGAAGTAGAVDGLVRLLADHDAEVRLVAARALGRIGDPRAAGPLVEALGSTSSAVPVQVAAQALLRVGLPAEQVLADGLSHPSAVVRWTIAEVLGRLGSVAAFDPLHVLLEHDPVVQVRVRAAEALGRVGLPGSLPGLLEATTPFADPAVRVAATRALGELGALGALDRLGSLLVDRDGRVAAEAAAALGALGGAGHRLLGDVARDEQGVAAAAGLAREALAVAALSAGAR